MNVPGSRGLAPGTRPDERSGMSLVSFDVLPDEAHVWCFGTSREPSSSERERLVGSVREFVSRWTAHGRDLRAGVEWLHDRFLLIGLDESNASASGCSVDALTAHLRHLGAELDLDLLDSAPVWYRDSTGHVQRVSRSDFTDLAARGEVSPHTPVFDLTLSRLGDLRSGRLEADAGSTWHRSLLAAG